MKIINVRKDFINDITVNIKPVFINLNSGHNPYYTLKYKIICEIRQYILHFLKIKLLQT